jgi:MFS family permease
MATQQLTGSLVPAQSVPPVTAVQNYSRPLAIVTTLFFMWGLLTCLNDILVPRLKSIFDLSYSRVMLVQFAFFSAYFLFSLPWAKIVNLIGYQRTMVAGLLTMAVGAFLFLPAASTASYPLFLAALIILGAGITGLQVAANPYVVVLGKPETAPSRLDLTQAFNSLGTTIAPKLGGLLILLAAPLAIEKVGQLTVPALHLYRVQLANSVKLPYAVIGGALVLLAVLIGLWRTHGRASMPLGFPTSPDTGIYSRPADRLMWGRLATCGGLSTRLGGIGTLVGRRVDNPPQADSLPHKFRSISDTGKTKWHCAANPRERAVALVA